MAAVVAAIRPGTLLAQALSNLAAATWNRRPLLVQSALEAPATQVAALASSPAEHHGRRGRLPQACWLFAALTAVSSAGQFCLACFGTGAVIDTGLSAPAAAIALSSNGRPRPGGSSVRASS